MNENNVLNYISFIFLYLLTCQYSNPKLYSINTLYVLNVYIYMFLILYHRLPMIKMQHPIQNQINYDYISPRDSLTSYGHFPVTAPMNGIMASYIPQQHCSMEFRF